jgi:hypothetical protein
MTSDKVFMTTPMEDSNLSSSKILNKKSTNKLIRFD